jgi:hypothetical protein
VETEAFAPDLATQAEWGVALASLLRIRVSTQPSAPRCSPQCGGVPAGPPHGWTPVMRVRAFPQRV